MKNIIALLLAAVILFGVSACARNSGGTASPDSLPGASAVIPATPVPTAYPAPAVSEPPAPVLPDEGTAGEKTPEAIWKAVYDEYGDTFPMTESVPAESLKELTGIDPEKLESFVFQFPMMNVSASEFFIAECREGQLEAVREEVEAHQAALVEQWKQYLPEQLELVEAYELETADNYIFFAVAENAAGAAEIFKGFFE